MKKRTYFSLIFGLIFLFLSNSLFSQQVNKTSGDKKGWTTDNPFQTDVFVENQGQFNSWAKSDLPIKYAVNNSDRIFFTPQRVVFRLEKYEKFSEEEHEEREQEREKDTPQRIFYVTMNWVGCNPDAEMIVSEPSEGYYTFGEKGYEKVKAKGYRKLLYKNLYPGIDVEYTIPKKGGIKYKLIVHPGAMVDAIKMSYAGDVESLHKDNEGNIVIETPAGDITDHAPESIIKETKAIVPSSFKLNGNIVSFAAELQSSNSELNTLEIDPWTILPSSLASDNAAYDIASDLRGNVYVSGGTPPHKLAKYSSVGNLLWTFTNPLTWAPSHRYYSELCILPQSGSVLIGEGWNYDGPRIMRINKYGSLSATSAYFYNSEEIWLINYDNCTGRIMGFGGGTQTPYDLQMISDTNFSGNTVKNFNGSGETGNDIADVVMDNNGDFYALMGVWSHNPNYNHLMKSLISNNYLPPLGFDNITGFDFAEAQNNGIPGLSYENYGATNRANALAINGNYIFGYDGRKIVAWNKTTGSIIDSVVVNNHYFGGRFRRNDGIAVDDCNNVYVGGINLVYIYSFNGTNFSPLDSISANINAEVFDISLNKPTGTLYVCGYNFITVFPVNLCPGNELSTATSFASTDSCHYSATVVVNNGTPPYSYNWSNGATTSTISGLSSGTYYVTVYDNSCIALGAVDSVVINLGVDMTISHDTAICLGSSVVLHVHGATTCIWSPSTGLSSITDSVVTAQPSITTIYTVTGTLSNGCTDVHYVTVNVFNNVSIIIVSNDTTICPGDNVMLNATGGTYYYWSPVSSLNNPHLSNPIASPVTSTIYTVTGLPPCTNSETVSVSVIAFNPAVNPPIQICKGNSVALSAIGGSMYLWVPTYGLNNEFSSSPVANPDSSTTYFVTISDGLCSKIVTTTVKVAECLLTIPNIFTPNGDQINDFFEINYKGSEAYNLVIFNRWGKKIFESNDKDSQWNGKINNNDAADGVYYYVLTISKKSYSGTVTLLR